MSSRARRVALFVVILVPLAAAAAFFTLRDEESPSTAPAAGEEAASEAEAIKEQVAEETAEEDAIAEDLEESHEHEHGHEPNAEIIALEERTKAAAEPVAREFFAAFARYELGELGPDVEATLRATTTSRFARELLSEPPRPILTEKRPTPAALVGEIVFVGRAGNEAGGFRSAELVGEVERDGPPTPIAFEMERSGSTWLVGDLGR